jgi:hypothetical protein
MVLCTVSLMSLAEQQLGHQENLNFLDFGLNALIRNQGG